MIEEIVYRLQHLACIWLALSVIYPVVNNKIALSAQRNNPVDHYRIASDSQRMGKLMPPALATLVLTAIETILGVL